jgi:hypothetical protein
VNGFLAALPPDERAQIARQTEVVTDFLHAWARPFGVVDPARFATTALTMAAAAPWLSDADLCDMATIPVWIFTIDHCFDAGLFAAGERRLRAGRYVAIAGGRPLAALGPAAAADPYARILDDVQARLARRPLFAALRPEWVWTCRRMLAGMIFECEAGQGVRGGAAPPTYRRYLAAALHSIGVPMYLAGAWVIAGDPAAPAQLPSLRALARFAGRAVRLANDLRTFAKEEAEGNFNALVLLQGRGLAPGEARRRVGADCRRNLRRLAAAARTLPPGPAVALVQRVTRFSVDFYAEHDFHTVGREAIHGL